MKISLKSLFTSLVGAIALLGLFGYLPGMGLFASIRDDYIPMAPSTAASFLVLCFVLLILNAKRLSGTKAVISVIATLFVALFGILEVAGHFSGMDLNFEDTIVPAVGTLDGVPIARMSPSTGAVFFLSGVAVFFLISRKLSKRNVYIEYFGGGLGILVLLTSFVFCLAYLYGTPLLYGLGATIPMALTTASGFMFLALAILISEKDSFPLRLLTDTCTHSYLLRFILPLSTLSVVLGGMTHLALGQVSEINPAFVSAALTVLIIVVTGFVATLMSRHMGSQIDRLETVAKQATESLWESEERFRRLTENVPDTIYRMSLPDGAYEYVSPAATEVFGYAPEVFINSPSLIRRAIHPDWDEYFKEQWELLLAGEMPPSYEYQIVHGKSGETKWLNQRNVLLRDGDGRPIATEAIVTDVTERKRAEMALQESEMRFRGLYENSPYGIVICQLLRDDDDKVIDFIHLEGNDATAIQAGFSLQDIVGKKASEIASPEELAKSLKLYEQAVSTGKSTSYVQYFSAYNRTLKVTAFPLVKDMFILNFYNTTERVRTEQALQESEKKYRTLFEAMTEMVVSHEMVFDESGQAINYRILDCNRVFTKITGISKDKAVGGLATEVYQSETAPYLEEYARVASTGEAYEFTIYYASMDKHFLISVVSPQKGQFATITTDITALKQIEEVVSAKNKELENYLYVASHDLRSPLVNIQGFSRRLQKQIDSMKQTVFSECRLDDETKLSLEKITDKGIPKSFDFIFVSVAKMDSLLNGLLQISRTGRAKMTIEKIDMNKLMEKIVQGLNFQIQEFETRIYIDALPDCYGDENLLDQLFSNLVSNALKYRAKERQLTISMTAQVKYNKVIYSLKDTGIGIAGRHLVKIWDVFFQVDSQAPEAGEGIGLSLVKRIADKHKGRVWVESEINTGTTFFVELQNNVFSE